MADVAYGSLPFAEQIAFFKRKLNLPTQSWTDIYRSEHDWAFVVAGANRDALLADFRTAVERAIEGGISLEKFRKDFDAIVAQHGWDYNGGRDWRSRVIYETNLNTSYAAGRYQQLQAAPYWQYIHADWVTHPRRQHQAWNGLVLARDDPFWRTHFPPNGWGCQCSVRGLWARDLQRLGKKAPDTAPQVQWVEREIGKNSPNGPRLVQVPEGIDPGFEYAPGKAQREAARGAMGATPASPSTVRAHPAPWRTHTAGTTEGDWHDAAFLNAPQWLKDAVAKRGALTGGVTNNEKGAFFRGSQDKINMQAGVYDDQASPIHQATWRHEYGHAIDHALKTQKAMRSADDDFTDAMVEDAHELIILGGHGPKSHKITKAAITKLQAAYADSAQELLQAPDRMQWLADRYAKNGLNFAQVQAAMKAQTHFAARLQGDDLQNRYARIITAIEQRDAQGLMDALTGGMGPQHMAERIATFNRGSLGNLSDLFGSATSNQVSGRNKSGFGHEDIYYKKHPIAGQAECFANLTCFYGDASPVWGQIIEAMTPRMAQLFKEIMK